MIYNYKDNYQKLLFFSILKIGINTDLKQQNHLLFLDSSMCGSKLKTMMLDDKLSKKAYNLFTLQKKHLMKKKAYQIVYISTVNDNCIMSNDERNRSKILKGVSDHDKLHIHIV